MHTLPALAHVKSCFATEANVLNEKGYSIRLAKNLANHGIEYIELGGIVSNPVISKVREGVELAKQHNVDAILSVGGGSVLDSTKAIAARPACYRQERSDQCQSVWYRQ